MSEPAYAPSEPSYQPPPWAAPPPSTKKRKTWLIVVVVATAGLLVLIGGYLATWPSPAVPSTPPTRL